MSEPLLPGVPDLVAGPDHTFTLHASSAFDQGRGTFGGLLAAAIGRATRRAFPDWPLRALSMHLCAPAPAGGVTIELRESRRGSRTLFVAVRILAEGQVCVLASATLARDRADDADYDHSVAPTLPSPTTMPDVFGMFGGRPPGAPVFAQQFDFRFATGIPFTAQDQPSSSGWIRPRQPTPAGPELTLALLDAWPLAVLCTLPAPRPAASIVIHLQVFPPQPAIADDAFYAVAMHSRVNRAGYSDQHTALHGPDGTLLGIATQLVAVIR